MQWPVLPRWFDCGPGDARTLQMLLLLGLVVVQGTSLCAHGGNLNDKRLCTGLSAICTRLSAHSLLISRCPQKGLAAARPCKFTLEGKFALAAEASALDLGCSCSDHLPAQGLRSNSKQHDTMDGQVGRIIRIRRKAFWMSLTVCLPFGTISH